MTFCHQRTKHYCFVACCASLLDESTDAFQESIVNRFPDDLRKSFDDVWAIGNRRCLVPPVRPGGSGPVKARPHQVAMDKGTFPQRHAKQGFHN